MIGEPGAGWCMPGAGGLSIANYCAAWRRCIGCPCPVLTERLLSGEPLRPMVLGTTRRAPMP